MTTTRIFAQRDYHDAMSNLIPAGQIEQVCMACEDSANIIVNLVDAYNSSGETLAHAAALSNRFIAAKFDRYQAGDISSLEVAAGSFLIAMKFREVQHPCIINLSELTGKTNDQIRAAEEAIVIALDWNINVPTGT